MNQNRNPNAKTFDIIDELASPPTSKTLKNDFQIKNNSKLITAIRDQENRNPVSILDTNLRIKELEKRFWELKEKLERKMTNIVENPPLNFLSNMKVMEEQSLYQWKEAREKMSFIENRLEIISNGVGSKFEHVLENVRDLRIVIEEVKSKGEKTKAEITEKLNEVAYGELFALQPSKNGQSNYSNLKMEKEEFISSEIMQLKSRLNELEIKRAEERFEWERKNGELYDRLSSAESEHARLLFRQREEILSEFRRSLEGMRSTFGGPRSDKNLNDLNEKIGEVENKLIRGNTKNHELKEYLAIHIDRRLSEFASELRDELDSIRERSKAISDEMQEGMHLLNTNNTALKFFVSNEIDNIKRATEERNKLLHNNLSGSVQKLREKISNMDLDLELSKKETGLLRNKLYTNLGEIERKMTDELANFSTSLQNTTSNYSQISDRVTETLNRFETEQSQLKHGLEASNQTALADINRVLTGFNSKIKDLKNSMEETSIETKEEFNKLQQMIDVKDKGFLEKLDGIEKVMNIKYESVSQNIVEMFDLEKKVITNTFVELVKDSEKNQMIKVINEIDDQIKNTSQGFKSSMEILRDNFASQLKETNTNLYDQLKETKLLLKNILKEKFGKIRLMIKNVTGDIEQMKILEANLRTEIESSMQKIKALHNELTSEISQRNQGLEGVLRKELREATDSLKNNFDITITTVGSKIISLKKDFDSLAPKIESSTDNKLAKIEAEVQQALQDAQKAHETQNSILKTKLEGDLQLIREYIGEIDATSRALMEARTMQEKAERVRNDKMVLMILEQKLQALDSYIKDNMANTVNKLETEIQVLKEDTERRCEGIDSSIKKTNDDLLDNVQQITADLQMEKMAQEVLMENFSNEFEEFKQEVAEEFDQVQKNQNKDQKNFEEALVNLRNDVEDKSITLSNRIDALQVQIKNDMTTNIETLNAKMDEQASHYNQKLGQNSEELSNKLNDLNSLFETNKQSFEDSINSLRDEIDKVEASVQVMDEDFVKRMNEQKDSLTRKIDNSESTLIAKIDKVGESCSQILTRMSDQLEKTAEDLSNEIQASSYLSRTYISAIESQLADKFESTDGELILIANIVQKLKSDLNGLAMTGQSDNKNLVAEIQKTYDAIEEVIKEQEQSVNRFSDFKSDVETKLQQHDQNLEVNEQRLDGLQSSIQKLDSNLNETNTEVSSLKLGLAKTDNEVSKINDDLETCGQTFIKLNDYINSVDSRLMTEELSTSATLSQIQSQTAEQIDIVTKEIDRLSFSLSAIIEPQLSEGAAKAMKNLSNLEGKLQEMIIQTNSELEQKLKEYCTSNTKLLTGQVDQKIATMSQTIDEQNSKIGQVAEETAKFATEQVNLKDQMVSTTSKLSQDMSQVHSKFDNEIEKLYSKITEDAVNTHAANLLETVVQKAKHEQLVENFNGLINSLADS